MIAEIASIVDGPISGEVKATTQDAEGHDRRRTRDCSHPSEYGREDSNDRGRFKKQQKYYPVKESKSMLP